MSSILTEAAPLWAPGPVDLPPDAEYTASRADLIRDLSSRRMGILRQLGYQNAAGEFIPGTVQVGADRSKRDLTQGMGLAHTQVEQENAQRQSFWSGRRAYDEQEAAKPFVQQLADLDVDTPQKLAELYDQAQGLMDEYETGHGRLLAELIARRREQGLPGAGVTDAPASSDTGAEPAAVDSTPRHIPARSAQLRKWRNQGLSWKQIEAKIGHHKKIEAWLSGA